MGKVWSFKSQNAERACEGWGALFYDQLKNPAVRSGLPDLPHLAHKRGARLERHLSRLPAGRRHLTRRADDEIGINDESPANVYTGID